ncbi:Transcription factor Dp-1 [Choanephora cucurbitarum]|uniref:Transcription factor Dp-1 n=2 Tax=Choanephora cucurbitarum TaxID=101091 RepID=A0A1C7NPY1_9FUNG|nr:Transcription factor Dp-1 [Choanephora cucurbitarum]
MSIYQEPTVVKLPPIKLPPLYNSRDDKSNILPSMLMLPDRCQDNHSLLLPPILSSNIPLSPPFSSCSSLSSSSLPPSPNSVAEVNFSSLPKKGSIQSLLNSAQCPMVNKKRKRQLKPQQSQQRFHQPYHKDARPTKGLRLFSKQVCDKVAEKGITTYNQVADELAAEIHQHSNVDQKNIRRRVYDALNVLMALDIIAKDRKQIKWLGMPTNDLEKEIEREESRHKELLETVQRSRHVLNDTLVNFTRLEKLVQRNRQEQQANAPQTVVRLPFFMMSSSQDIYTDSNEKEAFVSLGASYAIHQDTDILAKLWPSHQITTVS